MRAAQGGEFLLHGRRGDGAFDHVDDVMRAALVVAEVFAERVVLPARARAVVPLGGRGRDGDVGGRFEVRDAAEAVADDADFGFELRGVVELLEVAAAAATEVGAGRLDARGRGREQLRDRGEGDGAAGALDADEGAVAGRGERDEDGLPARVRQPDPARQDALDLDLDLGALAQRGAARRRTPARRLLPSSHQIKAVT